MVDDSSGRTGSKNGAIFFFLFPVVCVSTIAAYVLLSGKYIDYYFVVLLFGCQETSKSRMFSRFLKLYNKLRTYYFSKTTSSRSEIDRARRLFSKMVCKIFSTSLSALMIHIWKSTDKDTICCNSKKQMHCQKNYFHFYNEKFNNPKTVDNYFWIFSVGI